MTAKDAVLDLLRRQQQATQANNAEANAALLREWLQSLEELMNKLSAWLNEAEAANLVTVDHLIVGLQEDRFRTLYSAPALRVQSPTGLAVRIVPKARFVVGALGRVDLECPPKKVQLLRNEAGRWQIARLSSQGSGWRMEDLTEEAFWQTLGDLLQ